MSFGFSIGDVIAVAELAERLYKEIYLVARGAPAELKELANELSSLSAALRVLEQEMKDPQSVLIQGGQARTDAVAQMMANVRTVLEQLEAYAKKHGLLNDASAGRSKFQRGLNRLRFSKDAGDINSLRAKLNYQCNLLHLLLTSIGNSSLAKLQADNHSMSRNVDLIRDLIQTAMKQRAMQKSLTIESLPPPMITALDAQSAQAILSLRFLEAAERDRSWMETSLDVWLRTGEEWLQRGIFNFRKMRWLYANQSATRECRTAGIAAFGDLLKASWILNDVIRQHPQRPYVTSGYRQAPITALASAINAELVKLNSSDCPLPPPEAILSEGSLNIFPPSSKSDEEPGIRPTLRVSNAADTLDAPIIVFEGLALGSCEEFARWWRGKAPKQAPSFQCFLTVAMNEANTRCSIIVRSEDGRSAIYEDDISAYLERDGQGSDRIITMIICQVLAYRAARGKLFCSLWSRESETIEDTLHMVQLDRYTASQVDGIESYDELQAIESLVLSFSVAGGSDFLRSLWNAQVRMQRAVWQIIQANRDSTCGQSTESGQKVPEQGSIQPDLDCVVDIWQMYLETREQHRPLWLEQQETPSAMIQNGAQSFEPGVDQRLYNWTVQTPRQLARDIAMLSWIQHSIDEASIAPKSGAYEWTNIPSDTEDSVNGDEEENNVTDVKDSVDPNKENRVEPIEVDRTAAVIIDSVKADNEENTSKVVAWGKSSCKRRRPVWRGVYTDPRLKDIVRRLLQRMLERNFRPQILCQLRIFPTWPQFPTQEPRFVMDRFRPTAYDEDQQTTWDPAEVLPAYRRIWRTSQPRPQNPRHQEIWEKRIRHEEEEEEGEDDEEQDPPYCVVSWKIDDLLALCDNQLDLEGWRPWTYGKPYNLRISYWRGAWKMKPDDYKHLETLHGQSGYRRKYKELQAAAQALDPWTNE